MHFMQIYVFVRMKFKRIFRVTRALSKESFKYHIFDLDLTFVNWTGGKILKSY